MAVPSARHLGKLHDFLVDCVEFVHVAADGVACVNFGIGIEGIAKWIVASTSNIDCSMRVMHRSRVIGDRTRDGSGKDLELDIISQGDNFKWRTEADSECESGKLHFLSTYGARRILLIVWGCKLSPVLLRYNAFERTGKGNTLPWQKMCGPILGLPVG